MYRIVLEDGNVKWFNGRIIMKIHSNEDGTYTLEHFNNNKIIIKDFEKL